MQQHSTILLSFIFFPCIIAISVGLYFWLRGKDTKVKLVPFVAIAYVIVGLEVAKQIYGLAIGEYNLFWLPFHICTIAIIGFATVAFLRQDRLVTKIFWYLSLNAGFIVTIVMLVSPYPIIGYAADVVVAGTATYIDWYSVVVHYSFILLFAMGVSLRPYSPSIRDMVWSTVLWTVSLIIIVSMANILDENYANFLFFQLDWAFLDQIVGVGLWLFQVVLFLAYLVVYCVGAIGLYFLLKTYNKKTQQISKQEKLSLKKMV